MTTPRTTAKKLCTDTEFKLVNESFTPQVKDLSDRELVQRMKRARAARDKYRSLAQQQTRESRGRVAPRSTRPAAGNRNTVLKEKIFGETLARFEKHLQPDDQSDAASSASKQATASPKRSASAKKRAGAAAGGASKRTTAEKAPAKRARAAIPSLASVLKKVSKVVAERQEGNAAADQAPNKSAKKAARKLSDKAPAKSAKASSASSKARATREAIAGPNPKGPEFPRNAHERGRLSAAFKRQQARRDSR